MYLAHSFLFSVKRYHPLSHPDLIAKGRTFVLFSFFCILFSTPVLLVVLGIRVAAGHCVFAWQNICAVCIIRLLSKGRRTFVLFYTLSCMGPYVLFIFVFVLGLGVGELGPANAVREHLCCFLRYIIRLRSPSFLLQCPFLSFQVPSPPPGLSCIRATTRQNICARSLPEISGTPSLSTALFSSVSYC